MASPMTKCRQARFGVWILDRGYRTPEMRATNGEFAQTFTRFCADLGAVPPARGCWRSGMDSSWLRPYSAQPNPDCSEPPASRIPAQIISRNETRLRNFSHLFRRQIFRSVSVPGCLWVCLLLEFVCFEIAGRCYHGLGWCISDVLSCPGPAVLGSTTSARICEINFCAVPTLMWGTIDVWKARMVYELPKSASAGRVTQASFLLQWPIYSQRPVSSAHWRTGSIAQPVVRADNEPVIKSPCF
jgi:hypothetical protein